MSVGGRRAEMCGKKRVLVGAFLTVEGFFSAFRVDEGRAEF